MLRIWLVIPLALSAFSLMLGVRADYRDELARAGGAAQIQETLEFWVKARQDRRGLKESLEILRAESGFSGLGLCYNGRRVIEVGDLRGDCGLAPENALIESSERALYGAGPYRVLTENQIFSSRAGLAYFVGFVLFAGFVVFGIALAPSLRAPIPSRAPRSGRSEALRS